jgi:hypothetical protein
VKRCATNLCIGVLATVFAIVLVLWGATRFVEFVWVWTSGNRHRQLSSDHGRIEFFQNSPWWREEPLTGFYGPPDGFVPFRDRPGFRDHTFRSFLGVEIASGKHLTQFMCVPEGTEMLSLYKPVAPKTMLRITTDFKYFAISCWLVACGTGFPPLAFWSWRIARSRRKTSSLSPSGTIDSTREDQPKSHSESTQVAVIAVLTSVLLCPIVSQASFDETGNPRSEKDSAPLQSGLKVGEKVPTFYVRAITGPLKNKSVCYVCRNGDRPVVMLFIRKITPELKQLLKQIDREVDEHRAAGLRGFGVFVAGDSKELLPQVQTLAFDEKIELPLTIAAAPSDGSAGRSIHPDAAVTIILYRDQTVIANFAYRADELKAEESEAVLKGIRALADGDSSEGK